MPQTDPCAFRSTYPRFLPTAIFDRSLHNALAISIVVLSSPVFANFYARLLLPLGKHSFPTTELLSFIPFRINTCRNSSKQRALTSFRINTYKKHRGEVWSAFIPASAVLCIVCLIGLGQSQASLSSAHCRNLSGPFGTDKDAAQSTGEMDALLIEAKALFQQRKFVEADRIVRQYLEERPDSADGHFLLGHILFREIQADAKLEEQLNPQSHGVMSGVKVLGASLTDSRAREEKAKASLAEFTAGAKYHDPSASDLKTVALDYVLLGAYTDADKWLTKMLECTPNDSEGWYYLGRTKYNENRFAEAVAAFQQCLKLDPKNVKAEDNLGLSFAGLGRNEEAAAAYQQAIAWQAQSTSKNPGPFIDIGDLLLDQNRPQDAVTVLLQAVEIAPRDSRADELLGNAYARLEKYPQAQSELEKAIALSPQTPSLHLMLAPVYRKQGQMEKAKAEYDRCAALNGSHSTPATPRP